MVPNSQTGLHSNSQSCRYGSSRLLFRGPARPLDGRHIAFVGGSETLARSLSQAYPDILEQMVGETCVNFAQGNASIDVAMHDPLIANACREAMVTVVSVTGAVNMSNRLYSVHPRRNDRFTKPAAALEVLFPEVDYSQICFTRHLVTELQKVSASKFRSVREELQAAWLARMRTFLDRTGPNVILTWFAAQLPPTREWVADQDVRYMPDPLFVTSEMLNALRPLVRDIVVVPLPPPSNSVDPLGLAAHQNAAAALAGPIRNAMATQSLMGNHTHSPVRVTRSDTATSSTSDIIPAPSRPGYLGHMAPATINLSHGAPLAAPENRILGLGRLLPPRVSVAVLPFSAVISHDEDLVFADMLTEDITEALFQQSQVEVRVPPTVTDRQISQVEIDRLKEIGLSYVLGGSLRIIQEEIRFTAKLLDLEQGCYVWIRHFDRPMERTIGVLDRMGNEVVEGVMAALRAGGAGPKPYEFESSMPVGFTATA